MSKYVKYLCVLSVQCGLSCPLPLLSTTALILGRSEAEWAGIWKHEEDTQDRGTPKNSTVNHYSLQSPAREKI